MAEAAGPALAMPDTWCAAADPSGGPWVTRDTLTVAELVKKWQEDYLTVQQQLGRLKPSTIISYQCNLAGHIVPFFGAMSLGDVTLTHVQEFIKALLGKGLSPKTIGNVIVILKEMFKHAVQWGHLDTNPAQYVERPRGEDKEMDVFTPEEIRRLLDAQEEPLRTLLLTAALTGMRQGGLFGLQWEDVDFMAHLIHVRRALWRGTLGTPKSRRSRRAIDMPPTLEAALQRLSITRRSEFVFCSERGTPLDADNFRHREFPQALRRAGLRRVRFHDLRHTYTSLLIAHGAHPKYIQAQLGHASIQTTLDRYGHLMPQLHQAEAQKLDQLVFGGQATAPARRLTAVRVGRPPRGSKMGAVAATAGNHGSKTGADDVWVLPKAPPPTFRPFSARLARRTGSACSSSSRGEHCSRSSG
jgi:integrase